MFIEIFPAMFQGSPWANMFQLDESVYLIEKILRPLLVYIALIFLLRIFGKRELGQLNPFDLVVILSLSETIQNAIIGDDNSLVGGLVGAIALLGVNYGAAFLKFKSRRFEKIVEGTSQTIIENGKPNRKAIRGELLTDDDLDTIAHGEGLNDASEIEKCILDSNGSFFVEGNTPTSDERFRREVLDKLEELTEQLKRLDAKS